MRPVALILAIVLASCSPAEQAEPEPTQPPASEPAAPAGPWVEWPKHLPVYDHIVIVVEENKDWADIIGNPDAPYINQLAKEGALFTQSFGLEHHSQGNYYWLFSGSNQGVGFDDKVPHACNGDNAGTYCDSGGTYPFEASNLGQQLLASPDGLTFKGYSQTLPEIGSLEEKTHYYGLEEGRIAYARKHVPWTSFANLPGGDNDLPGGGDAATSVNLRFADFPADFNNLPTVSFVIPDLENDMHNLHDMDRLPDELKEYCTYKPTVCVGDKWLKDNLDDYYQWAKSHNSLLIFTFDEDNGMGIQDLTDPFHDTDGDGCKTATTTDPKSGDRDAPAATDCGWRNGVVTIFAGAHIIPGEYPEGDGITHVNILRTIEAMYGLPKSGRQQINALNEDNDPEGRSISDDYIITDVFTATR